VSDFRFEQPQWVHLVWAVLAFVAIMFWLDRRGSSGLDRFLSAFMQQRLVRRPKPLSRLMRIVLIGFCGVFLILALMRPQGGLYLVQTSRVGAKIMVCMDVSKSMLAEDVSPNRLRRAKAEVLDLLAFLDKDHVGLIAFAGKATVLCPMTPDFGFLRGVMETAGPHSVARGGTNLESPIRKALDGFRGPSDVSRVIILITDGEDHDSFPLEAAKAAAERGIRIVAIGFGDEAGSEVFVTDPKTGGGTRLLDADDRPVVTRLAGETLRKIAAETSGVYVPAGTGALDLAAIYEAHMEPLTRGRIEDHGRLVAQEQYQWAVLAALACLIAAATVAGGRPRPDAAPTTAAARMSIGTVVSLIVLATPSLLPAQVTMTAMSEESGAAEKTRIDQIESDTAVADGDEQGAVDPRSAYNEALPLLKSDKLDEAETKFVLARRHAGADGRTRYSATYNLGWVEVKRADRLIKEKPPDALPHLHAAADWFREAVRLAPDEQGARENLEVIGRRAIALADALARKDSVELGAQIDQLIEQQRSFAGLLQGVVQRVANIEHATIPDSMRDEFRGLEVEQRRIMTQLEEVTQQGREEVERLEAIDPNQRTAEQGLRMAQHQHALAYLYQASQRIGQTRRHLRGREADRAYRRASVALGQLKRARDQLRDLVEVLGRVITEATLLTRQTVLFAAAEAPLIDPQRQADGKPSWLTREFIGESLETVQQRTQELVHRIEAVLTAAADDAGAQTQPAPGPSAEDGPAAPKDQEQLRATLQQAWPLIRGAVDLFHDAGEAIQSQRDQDAYQAEAQATTYLMQAREMFLDIRPLIELIYANQKTMQGILNTDEQNSDFAESLPMLTAVQAANIKRGIRLMEMFDRELERIGSTPDPENLPQAHGGDPADTAAARTQQFETARKVLGLILKNFEGNKAILDRLSGDSQVKPEIEPLQQGVVSSIEQIETLRRIFFSVIEHLRDTLQRQVDVADRTRDVATMTDDEAQHNALGPQAARQQTLSTMSQQIADSLQKQSEQPMPTAADAGAEAGDQKAIRDAVDRLRRAAGHVGAAKTEMDGAFERMSAEPAELDNAQNHQAAAIEKLTEALQLLAPPPPPEKPKEQKDDQQQQQQQDQQKDDGADDQKDQPPQQEPQPDMSRLLQAVRDRDAQRQRDKRSRRSPGYAPVEKDW